MYRNSHKELSVHLKETNGHTINTLALTHTDTRVHAPSTVAQTDRTYANTKTCCVHSKETAASY